jgi:hypothetical protein
MMLSDRWRIAWAIVLLSAGGCGWAKRPYEHDPLIRGGHGVRGDHSCAHNRDGQPVSEPVAPAAPTPTHLPTLEWEK